MKTEATILYDSPEAATYRTDIEGWADKNGYYCGKDEKGEHLARSRSANAYRCECGEIVSQKEGGKVCHKCYDKKQWERYQALPEVAYDGGPVFSFHGDDFFMDEDALIDWFENNDDEDGEEKSIALRPSVENFFHPVEPDYWADAMPTDGDGELPKEMQAALDKLNEVISRMPAVSYGADYKVRTSYTYTP